jgi:hypothetical protein
MSYFPSALEHVFFVEIQDGGKSVYTESKLLAKGKGFPFKIEDVEMLHQHVTTLPNGNAKCTVEIIGTFEGRGFCACCIKMMYPMKKFQKATQEVMAPKAAFGSCPPAVMTIKNDLVWIKKRQANVVEYTQ